MVSWQAWKHRFCATLLLGVVATQAANAVPTLSMTATPDPAVVGSSVAVNVLISAAVDVYAYQFTLSFNPAILAVTSTTEGTFLSGSGTTFFNGGTVDNTAGTLSFAFNSLQGVVSGANGAGTLERINFNVKQAGTSALTFSAVQLLDSNLNTLAVTLQNRNLQAVPVPEPATVVLFALGLAGVAALRSRKAG